MLYHRTTHKLSTIIDFLTSSLPKVYCNKNLRQINYFTLQLSELVNPITLKTLFKFKRYHNKFYSTNEKTVL